MSKLKKKQSTLPQVDRSVISEKFKKKDSGHEESKEHKSRQSDSKRDQDEKRRSGRDNMDVENEGDRKRLNQILELISLLGNRDKRQRDAHDHKKDNRNDHGGRGSVS